MKEKIARLFYLTFKFLACKEIFNYKLYFSPESHVALPSKRAALKSKPKSSTTSTQPKHTRPKAKIIQNSTENDIYNEFDNVIEEEVLDASSLYYPPKKKRHKIIESPEDEEELEVDSSIYRLMEDQDLEEDQVILNEYAKIYKEKMQKMPIKRKKTQNDSFYSNIQKRIGKEREVVVALGNEINVYKQTQFLQEAAKSKIVLDELNLDVNKNSQIDRKRVTFAINEPKIYYIALPVYKFSCRARINSFERILLEIENRKRQENNNPGNNPSNNS
ncbi:unnamed protein product [Blepharisma stoltei]|uniref:Uncharacterized protein n=1 Tax=Blepharisma stoltei TaxID=1481888 RepID=A0AAU9JP03_9CILI|nr:unnamed protein product [Blepharisma stoltei]